MCLYRSVILMLKIVIFFEGFRTNILSYRHKSGSAALRDPCEALSLIIAAKSILRFSGTQKSEYVLVGTLLSFGIAVFSGILISFLNYR